ncbi:MAG: lysophospholipid acyltransferase family protein [Bdellovibrionia bacterium]
MRSFVTWLMIKWGKLLGHLPRYVVRAPGILIGFLWFDLLRLRKQIVLENLKIAFPEKSQGDRNLIARRSIYNLAYNFTEFFAVPGMDQEWRKRNIVWEGVENLRAAQQKNKGVFLLSMHLGNADAAANAIASELSELYLITKVFKNKLLNNMWFAIRGYHGVNYIDAHGPNNAFEILKALKKKAAVVFVLDQYMGPPYGIPTTFFGKRTGTAYGLALFVQKTQAPVVPVYPYEGEDGKIHIVFLPEVDTSSLISDDKNQTTKLMTQRFTDEIEACVRRHPEQWMWVHRRWKFIED